MKKIVLMLSFVILAFLGLNLVWYAHIAHNTMSNYQLLNFAADFGGVLMIVGIGMVIFLPFIQL